MPVAGRVGTWDSNGANAVSQSGREVCCGGTPGKCDPQRVRSAVKLNPITPSKDVWNTYQRTVQARFGSIQLHGVIRLVDPNTSSAASRTINEDALGLVLIIDTRPLQVVHSVLLRLLLSSLHDLIAFRGELVLT